MERSRSFVRRLRQRVAGAAPAPFVFLQYAERDKLCDVAQGCIWRRFFNQRVFRRVELAFESIQQAVENIALTVVEGPRGVLLPELGFTKDGGKNLVRTVECAIEASEKPFQPRRDIEIALLRRFEQIVVRLTLQTDLRRHAVEALRAVLGSGKRHIGNRAGDAAVAV